MSNYKIYLKQPPANIPSHYYDNGRVYLDLPTDFDLSLWNAPTRTKLEGFTELAVMQGDLPSTPKNDFILALYNDVNFLNADYTNGIGVLVENGGITLPQETVQVEGFSKGNKKYNFALAYSNEDIVNKLKSVKLCDLMGRYEVILDRDNIVDIYRFMSAYDGSSAFCLPPQNYGKFYYLNIDSTTLPIHAVEFRPNLFALAVFKEAFCGFRLEGSFLETDFFKKFITYDIRPDYDTYFGNRRKFLSSVIPNAVIYPSGVPTDVFQLTETGSYLQLDLVVDGSLPNTFGSDWNNTTFSFGNNRHGIYSFSFKCIAVPDGVGGVVRIGIFKNGTLLDANSTSTPYNEISFNIDVVELLPTDVIEVKYTSVSASGIDTQYIYDVEFTNTPIRDTTPYEGELFTLREALDQNVTAYDYIKGISDAFQLNYTINRATGVIGIYPEVNTSVFGEAYSPLVNPNLPPLDWSDKCDPSQLDIRFPKEQKSIKDITAAWKNSNDKYITEVINPDPELYSYYELVNGTGSESLTYENKLFEPSATDQYYFDANLSYMPDLPILLDNQDNKKSYNLGHRIFLLVGLSSQAKLIRYLTEIDSPTALDNAFFSFCTMYYPKGLLQIDLDTEVVTPFTFDKNLTYDKLPLNLYNTFIEKIALEKIESAEFDKPILLSREDFLNYNFTQNVVVKSNLNQVLCKVVMIKDFSLSKVKYTTVTLRPYIPRC